MSELADCFHPNNDESDFLISIWPSTISATPFWGNAQVIFRLETSIQSAQNSAHAKAMYDAKTKAYNDNINVWAPRNAVYSPHLNPGLGLLGFWK